MDWDDLRFLLSAAREGSMAGAGRALGVNQTTVARRVAAAELALGTHVFRREGMRLAVTAEGKALLARADVIEREVGILRHLAGEASSRPAGRVRVTAPLTLATRFLTPMLVEFGRAYPEIRIELFCDLNVSHMTQADAEVGLRISHPLADHLDIRAVSGLAFGLYANPRAMRANGITLDEADITRNPHIGYVEEFADLPEQRWVAELFRGAPATMRVNTTVALAAAVESGLGVASLPCYLGERWKPLRRIEAAGLLKTERLWLVTQRELRSVARVRVVVDFLARKIRQERALLSGRA